MKVSIVGSVVARGVRVRRDAGKRARREVRAKRRCRRARALRPADGVITT